MDQREEQYPKQGETWEHALTRNSYTIHSLSVDGWVRYQIAGMGYPVYTEPTMQFMTKYRRATNE